MIPVPTLRRPRTNALRQVLNAPFSPNRSGGPWDLLPHDLPAQGPGYNHFAQARDDGPWGRIRDARRQRVRVAVGKEPRPRAGSIDRRTVESRRPRSAPRGATTGARGPPA